MAGTTSHRAKAKSPRRAECCWQHALEHFTSIIHASDGCLFKSFCEALGGYAPSALTRYEVRYELHYAETIHNALHNARYEPPS